MKNAPNMKVAIAITVVALIGGVGACFYQYSALGDATARVDGLQKKSKSEKTLLAQADRTAAQLKSCTDRLAHLEQSVQEFAYVPTLLKELEATGVQSGLNVLGVRPVPKNDRKEDKSKSQERKPYDELKIEVKCRGDYVSTLKFLKALKSFPKIVAVRCVTLTPKAEPGQSKASKLDVMIELKTFVFPPADNPSTSTAGKEVKSKNG